MQPKTSTKINEEDFKILKRTIKNIAVSKRERKSNSQYATFLPESIGIKLTNRCNLRCKHCYQWNESGYHNFMDKSEQNEEMDFEIFKRIINETNEVKSRLYLWGGEPLVYRDFEKVAEMLENNPRETAICTNANLIEQNMDSLLKISGDLELLIGLEGFERENDEIRGTGTFRKVINSIELLLKLKEKGAFKGKLTIHTVINNKMADKLFKFVEFLENVGVDMVFLCFPWYISEECSQKMDSFFEDKFDFLNDKNVERDKSWHAFKYKIDAKNITAMMDELNKINSRSWKIRVRYQPGLSTDEVEDFILGKEMYNGGTKKCLALSNRMDINPDGGVSACKFFSEFVIGNLKDASIYEIWHSEKYNRIREVTNNGLMPVCSKCSVLHLHGI